MTITFLVQTVAGGGAEKQVLILARELARRDHVCRVISLTGFKSNPRSKCLLEAARAAGVEFQLPRWPRSPTSLNPFQVLRAFATPSQILWTWGLRSDLVGKLVAIMRPSLRLVCSLRSANEPRLRRDRKLHRFAHGRVGIYVANSQLNCDQLEAVVPGAKARCRVIYNALDTDELAQPPVDLAEPKPPLRIAMLGNLRVHLKGYDLALDLAEQIQNARLPYELHIAGGGVETPWLLEQIRQRRLANAVRYHGPVTDAFGFLRQSHLFLLLSRVEGVPNALLEAMAIGLPCIATRVGDVPRIASDRTHLRLVGVGDVSGPLGVLREFVADWPQARTLGRAAYALCRERFTVDRMTTEVVETLRRLADRTRA